MLLAVDVGNTQTVIGVYEGSEPAAMWRIATRADGTPDEAAASLFALLRMEHMASSLIDGMVVGSVVPEQKRLWSLVARDRFGIDALVVEQRHLEGLIEVRTTGTGADRLANAVAVKQRYGYPAVAVDMGTATDFEVVDAGGAFVGGIIAPGIETGMRSLSRGTALLPDIELEDPGFAIGANTADAIKIGVVSGEVERIDGLVRRIWAELGCECPVVATGGLSAAIGGLCTTLTAVDPELTLRGLRLIYGHAAC